MFRIFPCVQFLKISPLPRLKKSCSTDDGFLILIIDYLEMHGLLQSFGKIRTRSCGIASIASYRSRVPKFDSSRPIYSIVSDYCRANPNFSGLDSLDSAHLQYFSTSPTSATSIILLLSSLSPLHLRNSPVLFSLNFFPFLSFSFFFCFFFREPFFPVDFYQKYILHVYVYIRSLFRGGDIRPLDPRVKLTDMRIIKEVLTVRIWSRRADVVRRNSL